MNIKTLNSKIVYQNKWLSVREDKIQRPNKTKGTYYVVDKNPAVMILAINKKKQIYFVREKRYALNNKTILSLPAGNIEKSLSTLANAKKELWEETGLRAKKWKKLGKVFIGPGHESTYILVYLATELDEKNAKIDNQDLDEAILGIEKLTGATIKKHIKANQDIVGGPSLSALAMYWSI